MMAASANMNGGDHTVELIVRGASESAADGGSATSASEEITPLLTQSERPKINIFSVYRSRRKPRGQVIKVSETEISPVSQFILWVWNGSSYSGLICMTLSSITYFIMEVLSDNFTGYSVNSLVGDCICKMYSYRDTIIYMVEKKWAANFWSNTSQESFSFKSPSGISLIIEFYLLSNFSIMFHHCWSALCYGFIQRIPFSQAIVLSFTTPIVASIMARIILQETLKIAEIGGLACSFFGMLFIFQQMLTTQGTEQTYYCGIFHPSWDVAGGLLKAEEASNINLRGSQHMYAVLIGLFSSISGGISYCLIKAAAKESDQPVVTVLSFGILASPAAGICTFAFEEFVLPGFYSLSLMIALGILSFLAEVLLARGLQLEKISKVANVQFIEAALSQLWGISTSRVAPSFGRLVGCLLILISVSCTMFLGPQKETE
ncbi:EamA domain - like 2 [Theobroma cacao]|nr:EamA domain - like 2 [Theobroma cacao]